MWQTNGSICVCCMDFAIGSNKSSVVQVSLCKLLFQAGRKLILLLGTLILLVCQGLIVAIIRVFNLEEEEHRGAGYALTVLFCLYAVVYAGAWV